MKNHKGERSNKAKLTDEQARDLKKRVLNGEPRADLAREFGINYSSVNAIKKGINWAHIQVEGGRDA